MIDIASYMLGKKAGGGGGEEPTGSIDITQNGTENVKAYATANVNVPNSYSAGDEGKVVSNGALVAQNSDTVTENDTYDTTLINSLTVNVDSGLVLPDFLAHSIQADILISADANNYESGDTWDGLSLFGGNYSKQEEGVRFTDSDHAEYMLEDVYESVTVYLIARQYESQGGDKTIMCVPYANQAYACPNFYSRDSNVWRSVWNGDVDCGQSSLRWNVLTLAIDGSNKRAYHYLNYASYPYIGFSTSGSKVCISSAIDNANSSKLDIMFVGIVKGLEPTNVILSNQLDLLTIMNYRA